MKRQQLSLTQFFKSWATEQVHTCVVAIFLAKHAHSHHKVSLAISYPIVFPLTRHLLLSGTVPLRDEAVCSVSQVHLRCDRERHQGPPRAQCWHADGGCRHTQCWKLPGTCVLYIHVHVLYIHVDTLTGECTCRTILITLNEVFWRFPDLKDTKMA